MIEIHGHRGFRGRWPENTIVGFLKAFSAGATASELDVVMAGDGQILVSHEPWMNHEFCLDPAGNVIAEEDEKKHNIYRMSYPQISRYNCGGKINPLFPGQTPVGAIKPLLRDVVEAVSVKNTGNTNQIRFNIEVKFSADEEGEFYPPADIYVQALLLELQQVKLNPEQFMVQAFDAGILREIKRQAPAIVTGLLVESAEAPEVLINHLGFLPDYFNPEYKLLSSAIMDFCTNNNIKVLPWTVNDPAEMLRMLKIGASGLITDYPDIAASIVKAFLIDCENLNKA